MKMKIQETKNFFKLKYMEQISITCIGLYLIEALKKKKDEDEQKIRKLTPPKWILKLFLWTNHHQVCQYLQFIAGVEKGVVIKKRTTDWPVFLIMFLTGLAMLLNFCQDYTFIASFVMSFCSQTIMGVVFWLLGRPVVHEDLHVLCHPGFAKVLDNGLEIEVDDDGNIRFD